MSEATEKEIKETEKLESQTTQSTQKKKPGPKPKTQEKTSEDKVDVTGSETKTKQKEIKPNKTEIALDEISSAAKIEETKEAKTSSFYISAHILQRCPVFKTPSTQSVVVCMINGFVFAQNETIDGFRKIRYNASGLGAKEGFVESCYVRIDKN